VKKFRRRRRRTRSETFVRSFVRCGENVRI
jgi:hypothetical protein